MVKYAWNLIILKKKNGACVFWAPVFFLSFLAGKLRHSKQMLLTEFQWIKKKKKRFVFWAPVFFLSFLARKLNVFKQLLPKKPRTLEKGFFDLLFKLDLWWDYYLLVFFLFVVHSTICRSEEQQKLQINPPFQIYIHWIIQKQTNLQTLSLFEFALALLGVGH